MSIPATFAAWRVAALVPLALIAALVPMRAMAQAKPLVPVPANIWEPSQIERKESQGRACLLYTSPSPRDLSTSRMPSSA